MTCNDGLYLDSLTDLDSGNHDFIQTTVLTVILTQFFNPVFF